MPTKTKIKSLIAAWLKNTAPRNIVRPQSVSERQAKKFSAYRDRFWSDFLL